MNRTTLIGGAVIATIVTLMSSLGAATQLSPPGSSIQTAPTDVIIVVSDLVDLEGTAKINDDEERQRREVLHIGHAAHVAMDGRKPPDR